MKFFRKHFGLFFIITFSIFSIIPFLNTGFFPMHDNVQVARVYEMEKALRNFQFPVRWVTDFGYGYGYPIFNFYAPLPYYLGGFLMLAGLDALVATKVMMIAGVIIAGITMYMLAREFWGELGGVVAGLFYMFAPYHAVQIYVRGSVGEFWAYAFLPLVFLGIYKLFRHSGSKVIWEGVIIGSVGFAGVVLSHNLTALMIVPFVLCLGLVLSVIAWRKKKLFIIYYLLFIILGLLLSAFYWLPAIAEMKYTNVESQVGGGADFRDHFVCMYQLWDSPWGFGGSSPGCTDGLSFRIGKLHILSVLLTFLLALFALQKGKKRLGVVILSILGLGFSIFLMLENSRFVWESIPAMAFIQYPWRFLALASFFASIISGGAAWYSQTISGRIWQWSPLVLVGLLFYFNLKHFQPQTIYQASASDFTNKMYLNWTASKISDEYMPKGFKKPKSPDEIPQKKIEVIGEQTKVNIAYFPAWKIYLNGEGKSYKVGSDGIYLDLPKGNYELNAVFRQTPIEAAANILSIFGVLVAIFGIIKARYLS